MAKNGYDGYRGRTRAQSAARAIVGTLVILLVLAILGLIFAQRYIVYTDDGIHLDIPFVREETAAPPDVASVSVEVLPRPETEQTPETRPVPDTVRAVFAGVDELEADGISRLTEQGANTVVLDMKGEDGVLGYVSALPLADGASTRTDRVSDLIQTLHQADVHVVARVSCFRDDTLGRRDEYALLTNSGYRWNYDPTGLYWVNPYHQPVQEYMAGVVGELAGLGFDEVLLDSCGYPTQGELGWIRRGDSYDPSRLDAVVDSFLILACRAVEGTDTVVSVWADGAVLDGTDTRSGLTLQRLNGMDGRVWLRGEDMPALQELVSQTELEQRVVWPAADLSERDGHCYLTQ